MTRTQIQLPDELYQRAKAFAAQRELSLAEVMKHRARHHPSPLTRRALQHHDAVVAHHDGVRAAIPPR